MNSMLLVVGYMLQFLQVNCADNDKTPLTAASNLDLHCLPVSKNGLYANIGLGFII